jgi:hypothetical protein
VERTQWTELAIGPYGRVGATPHEGYVVARGVAHVPIDVLPREVATFRTICGQDVVEDEPDSSEDVIACSWCRRVERTWILVKSAELI